jgi:orotate phosphoribosyltransferase-like protein
MKEPPSLAESVAELADQGLSDAGICAELHITPTTLQAVLERLGRRPDGTT